MIFYNLRAICMLKVVGMNGADSLNIQVLNLRYTFKWYFFNLCWKLSYSFKHMRSHVHVHPPLSQKRARPNISKYCCLAT